MHGDAHSSLSDLFVRGPLFGGLTGDESAALTPFLRRRAYARGAIIFRRGDPGESLFVIASGAVHVTLSSRGGKQLVLARLGPGDFFGELALLDGEPRSANVVAVEPTELVELG